VSTARQRKRVAVIGASGYTGREVLHWLAHHPGMAVTAILSSRPGEQPDPPALPGDPVVEPLDLERLRQCDGVFLCTPHGTSADLARAALQAGCKVVDLSADFRLRDGAVYQKAYGIAHHAPELLGEAIYGLCEHARARVAKARLCANPGCYPTSVLLPLLPLLQENLLDLVAPIVASSASGVSGAGKNPSERTHFGNVHDNFLAYGVGTHRHLPEIWQEAKTDRIAFVPHLLPVFRGILTTLYLQTSSGGSQATIRSCLQERYAREPFVKVLASGLPELRAVQHTNECHIAVGQCGPLIVVVSAIDNLVKGASGQAVQNMNLMLGLPETEGLL
jgi:N-acetyl-gamma-glutamyl-phosphate reductase